MPGDITGTEILQDDPETSAARVPLRARARSSPTSSWPTRSTARRPRRRRRCSRRCRSARSRPAASATRCPTRSSCSRRRTRSSRRAPTRCPRRSSTASCSWCTSATRARDEEREILRRTTGGDERELDAGARRATELLELQERRARACPIADHVLDYALALTRGTRVRADAPLPVRARVGHLGRRAAREPVPGARRQGARRARRAAATSPIEDVQRRRAPGAAPPHRDQLLGRGRGHHLRQHHRPPAGRGRSRARRSAPACPGVRAARLG